MYKALKSLPLRTRCLIIILLALVLLSSSCSSYKPTNYTRYTPNMMRADKKQVYCHTYKNTKPVKKEYYQRYKSWRR